MDPKKALTPEQVIEFFSQTAEFQVTHEDENLKITYTSADEKSTSVLLWKNEKSLNFQQLIRKIKQLVWNECNDILD